MGQHKGFSKQVVLYLSETEGQVLDKLVRRHGTEDPGLTQLEMNELLEKDVLDHFDREPVIDLVYKFCRSELL